VLEEEEHLDHAERGVLQRVAVHVVCHLGRHHREEDARGGAEQAAPQTDGAGALDESLVNP
jgi:hypothetical protein